MAAIFQVTHTAVRDKCYVSLLSAGFEGFRRKFPVCSHKHVFIQIQCTAARD